MDLIIKQYDPTRPKKRVARRTQEQATTQQSLPGPPDDEHSSLSSPENSFDVGDPYADFPSVDECFDFCTSTTDVSRVCTPASANSPACQIGASAWRGQDSSIEIEDDSPDPSGHTTNLSLVDAASGVMLLRDDLRQGCALPASRFPDAIPRESSNFGLSTGPTIGSAEALGVPASAVITAVEGAKSIGSAESAQTPDTGTFPSKRSLPDRDAPNGSKRHGSEIYRSPKRPRRSVFNARSPLLESNGTCPPPASCASESIGQSSDVPRDDGFPPTPASQVVSSPVPTGGGLSLADIKRLFENQTKQLLESQTKQISLLTAEVESLKRKVSSGSQVKEHTSDDEDDGDGNNDSDSDSTQPKSAQRRKWTSAEEGLLRQLKFTQSNNSGRPSDHAIAKRLKRSEDGVKQHWTIMQKIGGKNSKGRNNKRRKNNRKA